MKLFRKIRGKFGFTLAEMLIVVAILAILTAVAAPNVAKYSRSINLRELNDSARAIYMAAEHKFMNEIEMGRTLPEGAAVNTTALEKRYGDDASAVNVKYLKSSEEPLKKLMTSGSAAGDSTGVIESQLYDNNYIVEYNPETGDVFGVFYSEDDNLSGYEANCYPYIAEMQKEKLIGYYGSDNVKPEEKTNSKVLPKPEVEIINKEKLVVRITAPEVSGGEPISIKVKVNDTWIVPETGYNIVPGTTVDLILDSLISSGKPTIATTLVNSYEASIADWLGAPVEDCSDMTLTVTFYDPEGKTRDQSVTKTFNPLFANGSTADTAYIEYGRHLQNLDKCSAINTAVIKKTINFASKAENYEGWANPDVYPGRKFVSLPVSSINISARSGAEIQNIDIEGVIVYEKDDTTYSGLFTEFFGTAKQLVFRNPTVNGSIAGTLCGYTMSATVENVKVINPKVESDSTAGGLIGMDSESVISNCAVYVAEDENYSWGDPNNDPYYHYTIVAENTDNYSGGLVGLTTLTTIKESYAAVKVSCEKGKAGGLVGFCSSETFIENSFSAGHTYYGIFEGNAKDGKEINLKDNVRGNIAGGIVSESQGDNEINIIGTVFSTCSVSGTTVDLAYNGTAVIKDGATVYTLGTAYKDNGDGTFTEIKKSADTHVKTGDDVKVDDSSAAVGKRYDLKVSSVYKYPVRDDMTMHGDWPSSDAVTGFFYWEKHGEDYNFHILCDDCHEKEYENLCKKQDGSNITAYGYGAFSVGGSLDSAVTFCDGTDDVTIDEREEDAEKTVEAVTEAIQKALAGVDDLKITDLATVAVKLYDVTDVSGKTFVTATVSGNDYKFAPDFYAISADKGSDHAGTDADVFGVRCKNHLQNVANALAGNFVQSHDINYKDDTTGGLTPIGTDDHPFAGAYDGGSYRIINAKFNTTEGSDYAGLFGVTNGAKGAKLENIVMFVEAAAAENFVEIKGKTVGVIVGNAENASGEITNCVAAGYTVIGSENSGGIAGISACPITNCEANVSLSGDGKVGGIVGEATAKVDNCYALVHGYDGKADETLGGIAGKISEVTNCYVIFSGQISGYPVANVSSAGTNYYVKERGFYQGRTDRANIGTEVSLNIVKRLDQLTSKTISESYSGANTAKMYVTSATVPESAPYPYFAIYKNGSDFEHYGPIPLANDLGRYLANGPFVGIYNVGEYKDSSEDFPHMDGLLTYNRYGLVYESEKMIPSNLYRDNRHIGVFFEQGYVPWEDPYLEIYVNGNMIDLNKMKQLKRDRFRGGFYTFETSKEYEDRVYEWKYKSGQGADANTYFVYYVLYDDEDNPIEYDENTVIEIRYTKDSPGTLLRATGSTRSKEGTSFAASLPESGFDENDPPKTATIKVGQPDNIHTYAIAYDGTSKKGATTGLNRWVGLAVAFETTRIQEYEEGRFLVLFDNVLVELVPWDELYPSNPIENKSEAGLDGFTIYGLKFENEVNLWNDFALDIIYGTTPVVRTRNSNF